MIPVFRKYFFWALLLMISSHSIKAQDFDYNNNLSSVIYFSDSIYNEFPDFLYVFTPVYSNPLQTRKIRPISYEIDCVSKKDFRKQINIGLYLCSFNSINRDTVKSYNIFQDYDLTQIIKTRSKGYIGYLEELVNVPFVLPPRLTQHGHQTDSRLGVDCAELAIYGKRRQGFDIPYCGPLKITSFLKPVDSLKKGTVIHFGHQVSVLYKDKGKIGMLDKNDLLIHAYKDKAEIIELGKTDLRYRDYELYKWKRDLY